MKDQCKPLKMVKVTLRVSSSLCWCSNRPYWSHVVLDVDPDVPKGFQAMQGLKFLR